MDCRIFEKLLRGVGEGRRDGQPRRSDAPIFAPVHVTCGDWGPDRTGAVKNSKGKSQGMWITRAGVSNKVK